MYWIIQPLVSYADTSGRSVLEICQPFGIPSNQTFYKIVELVRPVAKK